MEKLVESTNPGGKAQEGTAVPCFPSLVRKGEQTDLQSPIHPLMNTWKETLGPFCIASYQVSLCYLTRKKMRTFFPFMNFRSRSRLINT